MHELNNSLHENLMELTPSLVKGWKTEVARYRVGINKMLKQDSK